MSESIICFEHCETKIFCNDIPDYCPACNERLSTSTIQGLPFRLPYPFVKAVQYPCAVVMKPTEGTFLDDYQNDEYLHIGVTDSKGSICDYDSNGLHKERIEGWEQSLLIYKISEPWKDLWDTVLQEIQNDPVFTKENYDEANNNCYTFVLEFLKRLKCQELVDYIESKEKFCEQFVVTKSKAAAIYISLKRKLVHYGYFIERIQK